MISLSAAATSNLAKASRNCRGILMARWCICVCAECNCAIHISCKRVRMSYLFCEAEI